MNQVVVAGAGVIGLTSAIHLLENGFSVKIITRDMPHKTTSAAAGAIWAGYDLSPYKQKWAKKSLAVFQEQAKNPDSGVLMTTYNEYFRQHEDLPWYCDSLDVCETLPASTLPTGYICGYETRVPLIQAPKYLDKLLARFEALGGTLQQREIQSLDDVSDYPLVVNCTGVGARQVASDEAVHPIWGQTLLANIPHIKKSFMDDERFTYIFPREDGTILGGVHVHERWDTQPDERITEDILKRCKALAPLGGFEIIKTNVGLRPGRHEVRLEREQFSETCTVIHNYGHGGIGWTLSWGCAEDVVTLAKA